MRHDLSQPASRGHLARWTALIATPVLIVGTILAAPPAAEAAHQACFINGCFGVTATVGVGKVAQGVTADPRTHNVFVTGEQTVNAGGRDAISVIDEASDANRGTVTATIDAGHMPEAVAEDVGFGLVYVVNFGGTVSVIDESGDSNTGTVTSTVDVGSVHEPIAAAVDQSTHNVYVAGLDGTLSVIDESGDLHSGMVTAVIATGQQSIAVAVDQVTHNVFVANRVANTVSVVDESGDSQSGKATATIGVGQVPDAVDVDSTTHNVYVANYTDGTVSVIDESGDGHRGAVTTIGVGALPQGLAVDPSTKNVFVASGLDRTVSVIHEAGANNSAGSVTATINGIGAGTTGVAVDSSTHYVFAVNTNDDTVSVIAPIDMVGRNFSAKAGKRFASRTTAQITDLSAPGASAFSADIHWGDGTDGPGAITGTGSSYQVAGSHTYHAAGAYTVTTVISEGPIDVTVTSTATVK